MALAPNATGAVAQSLRGIAFPCDKRALVAHARGNNADYDVIEVLERIPERRYDDMTDVFEHVGAATRH